MSLAEKLDRYNMEYWDFKNSKIDGIHKIASYPDATVFMSMQVFAPMLNFIYDILLIEK